jgi:hypothetical protein
MHLSRPGYSFVFVSQRAPDLLILLPFGPVVFEPYEFLCLFVRIHSFIF